MNKFCFRVFAVVFFSSIVLSIIAEFLPKPVKSPLALFLISIGAMVIFGFTAVMGKLDEIEKRLDKTEKEEPKKEV